MLCSFTGRQRSSDGISGAQKIAKIIWSNLGSDIKTQPHRTPACHGQNKLMLATATTADIAPACLTLGQATSSLENRHDCKSQIRFVVKAQTWSTYEPATSATRLDLYLYKMVTHSFLTVPDETYLGLKCVGHGFLIMALTLSHLLMLVLEWKPSLFMKNLNM